MKIKLIKFKEDLIPPSRAHYNDAGLDCHAQSFCIIKPGQITVVPLDFGLAIPDGFVGTIRPRSSWNLKGVITMMGTIDSGYRGEIKAAFLNLSGTPVIVQKGDKICQLTIEPVVLVEPVGELVDDRGDKGFGSTGR